jgi:hypothetical protein
LIPIGLVEFRSGLVALAKKVAPHPRIVQARNIADSIHLVRLRERNMPMLFIHVLTGDMIAEDYEGINLPSPEEAHAIAIVSARELLADNIKSASTTPLKAVTITDESGKELMTILAKDVLPEPLK